MLRAVFCALLMCFLAQSARSQSCKEIEYAHEKQSRLNCEKLKEKRQTQLEW
jgi:hypothetical protein